MSYKVYTQKKSNYGYMVSVARKGLTLENARKFRDERMANPNRTCDYIVVADSKETEYLAKIEMVSAKMAAREEKKWTKIDEMKKKGYVVRDVIAYLNK